MIHIHYQEIGEMWYATAIENEKVFATTFSPSEQGVLKLLLESLPYDTPFQMAEKSSPLSTNLLKTLKEIFNGNDVSLRFNIALDHLSTYTRRVLECVSLIPIGYLTTYNAVAKTVGGSPRAVGRAVASNPFPLLIPCHRVVRANFSIGGYGLGEKIKWMLLKREDRGYLEAKTLKIDGKILPLFPVNRLRKG